MKKKLFLLFLILQFSFINNAQVTIVPDSNFEQALIDLGYDSVLDNSVQTANINAVTYLDVQNQNISDLTGIEDFTALQTLFIDDNNLVSIDLSQNAVLAQLSCSNNSLKELDMTTNTSLWYLDARFNQLTDINLSQNTSLQVLSLEDNELTLLNLNPNTQLTILSVKDNNLGGLAIKNGNNTDIVSFDATNNPGLLCILVDDVSYSNTNWTNIDPQTSFSFNNCISQLNTYVPDDNFEQALIDLGYDSGPLDNYIPTSNINTVTILNVDIKNIDDLTGIKDFVALEELSCAANNLTELNLSNNTQLQLLNCAINNLTELDVSQNTLLQDLWCSGNQIVNLDVSENEVLDNFQCHSNQLTSLDLSSNTLLTYLNVRNNQLTSLDLTNNTLLTDLNCDLNVLTSLDLSLNTSLEVLDCNSNLLTSLNLKNSNNTAITWFEANNNPDLTCIEVDDAAYSTTNWTNIDAQTSFSEDCSDTICSNAQPINVSSIINTINFNLIDEPIRNEEGCSGTVADYADTWFEFTMPEDGDVVINGSINGNKFALYDACAGNQLACFGNSNVINGLTSGTTYKLRVFRTAANASNSNFTSFDILVYDTLNTDDFVSSKASVELYPNPASEKITITSNLTDEIGPIFIMDVSGKKLLSKNQSNIIDVKHLANGIYFARIQIDNQFITKKIIIKK